MISSFRLPMSQIVFVMRLFEGMVLVKYFEGNTSSMLKSHVRLNVPIVL